MKVPEGKRFYLAFLIVCIATKQVMKVLKNRKFCLVHLILYRNKLCYKILRAIKVHLIYLVFFLVKTKIEKY